MAATATGVDPGTVEIKAAKDLMIIWPIQRKATDQRVRSIFNNWDDSKVGILQVAKITDGEYKNRLHIYDGGTRWRAQVEYGSNIYPFTCWVRKMTMAEAAEKFLDENSLSQKPSAFYRYSVGIRAGKEAALAIQAALARTGLEASPTRSTYGNGIPGTFAALAAAERVVLRSYQTSGDWGLASDALAWCIEMGRKAYPQHGDEGTAQAHDADLIQALAVIGALNPNLTDEKETNLIHSMTTWLGDGPLTQRLFRKGDKMDPPHWRVMVIDSTKNTGGSTSRGYAMARQIVLNHNRAFTPVLTVPPAAK